MEENPYQPPASEIGVSAHETSESIRRAHLGHETTIRTLGAVFVLGAIGFAGIALWVLVANELMMGLGVGGLFGFAAAVQFWVGRELIKLHEQVRVVAALFLLLGLLAFPVGTLMNGYLLYVLCGAKGSRILSDDYKAVVAATRHIQNRGGMMLRAGIFLLLPFVIFITFLIFAIFRA